MKRLQVYKDFGWKYVFCYNELQGIITTDDKRKALQERDLEYFKNRFGNDQFRIVNEYKQIA